MYTRHLLADLKFSFGNEFLSKLLFGGRVEIQGEARNEKERDTLQSFTEHSPGIHFYFLRSTSCQVGAQAWRVGSLECD